MPDSDASAVLAPRPEPVGARTSASVVSTTGSRTSSCCPAWWSRSASCRTSTPATSGGASSSGCSRCASSRRATTSSTSSRTRRSTCTIRRSGSGRCPSGLVNIPLAYVQWIALMVAGLALGALVDVAARGHAVRALGDGLHLQPAAAPHQGPRLRRRRVGGHQQPDPHARRLVHRHEHASCRRSRCS